MENDKKLEFLSKEYLGFVLGQSAIAFSIVGSVQAVKNGIDYNMAGIAGLSAVGWALERFSRD